MDEKTTKSTFFGWFTCLVIMVLIFSTVAAMNSYLVLNTIRTVNNKVDLISETTQDIVKDTDNIPRKICKDKLTVANNDTLLILNAIQICSFQANSYSTINPNKPMKLMLKCLLGPEEYICEAEPAYFKLNFCYKTEKVCGWENAA